jgi:hypothetical protein
MINEILDSLGICPMSADARAQRDLRMAQLYHDAAEIEHINSTHTLALARARLAMMNSRVRNHTNELSHALRQD